MHLLHPNVPVLDRTALSSFDEAGVRATVIRKLLVFLQVKK
jgi:hypothetical protein